MMNEALDLLMDPAVGRIIVEIMTSKEATVNQISAGCTGIPRSTIYRRIAKMEKQGIVEVVRTEQKRGTIEKTYRISESFSVSSTTPTKEQFMLMFSQYCLKFQLELKKYLDGNEVDMKHPETSFGYAPFYATPSELEVMFMKMGHIVQDMLENPPSPERKAYCLGSILTPWSDPVVQPSGPEDP